MPANRTDTIPPNPPPERQWLETSDGWFYSAIVDTDTFKIGLSMNRPGSAFATPAYISTVRTAIDRAFWLIEQSGLFPHHIHRNVSIIFSDSDLAGQNVFYDDDGVTLLIGQSIINPSSLPQTSGKPASLAETPGVDRLVATLLNHMAIVVYEACDPNAFWSEFQARHDGVEESDATENGSGFIQSPITHPDDAVSTVATETQLGFIAETLAAKWLNQKLSPASRHWLEVLLPGLFKASPPDKPPTPLSARLRAYHWHSKNHLDRTLAGLKTEPSFSSGNVTSEATPSSGNVTGPVPDNYFAFTPVAPLLRINETMAFPAFGTGYCTRVQGTEIGVRVYPQGDAAPPLRLVDITLDVESYQSLAYKDPTQTLQRLVFDLETLAGLFLYGGFNEQLLAFLHGLQDASDPVGSTNPDHKIPLIKAESDRLFIDSDATFTNGSQPLVRLGLADLSRHSAEALGRGLSALLIPTWRETLTDNPVAVAGIEQLWGITGNGLEALQPNYGLDERYQARQWPQQSGVVYQRLVAGQRHNLRKRGGTARDFVDAVRELYLDDGLASALARVMEDQQPLTESTVTAGEMADLLQAIIMVYNEQSLRSEQWAFRRAIDDSLDWLTAKDPDNPALANLKRLKRNDEAQQDGYDGLTEMEPVPFFDNTTSSIRGRFFTLTALGDWIGVYLSPDYLTGSSNETIVSDLRRLVDASDLFRHRLNNTNEFQRLSGNVTSPIRPNTLGDIHDIGLLEVPPEERNRTIPGEYVSLIIPGHNGASPGGKSGPLAYLLTRHGAENDTVHDPATENRTALAPVNQTVNNGTFTLIHFDPGWGGVPFGAGWLSDHVSFFFQLKKAFQLALGIKPEEDANRIKNRIRTELGLPRDYSENYPGQNRLAVVDPRQVMIKEALPVQVRFNQTTATDTSKSVRLAVTGYGSLGRHLELTAEPDKNGTYRLQLASIGRMTTNDGLQPPPLHEYPEMTKPVGRHRVRRADPDPAEGSDSKLIDKLIPDAKTFHMEYAAILQYKRILNADLNRRFEDLFSSFMSLDSSRHGNAPSTFASALRVYEKLTDLIGNHPQETGVKFAKLATDIRSWFESNMKSVPPRLHFVSVNPTDGELNYIRSWILANSESVLRINLWHDPNAMLAGVLAEALKESVTSKLTGQSDPGNPSDFESDLLKELMRLQDEAWKAIEPKMASGQLFDQAAKDFLIDHLKYKTDIDKQKAQTLESFRQFEKEITSSYPGAKFSLKDINELWTSAYGEDGQKAKKHYYRELGLRGHQPAANALVKIKVISTLGGLYSDTSLSPALNEDLFKGIDYSGVSKADWDRVKTLQTQLVIQRLGKEFLPDNQDPAIKQKVSEDIAWFGEKYPGLKSDIEQLVANADPSQLFKPLGKVKVMPYQAYVPSEKNPGLFFAARPGNPTIELAYDTLLSQFEEVDRFKVSGLTNWNAARLRETFLIGERIADAALAYYRIGGVREFAKGYRILNGDNALQESKIAMSWTAGYKALLAALQLSPGDHFTLSSEAAAARDQENDIRRYINTDPRKHSQYRQQLVIQMGSGDDNPISKASRYLFRKYKNRQQTGGSEPSVRWLVIENDDWSDGETGAKINSADIGKLLGDDSRIHVVGLGESKDGEFTLGGQTASDLSKKINELIGDTPVKTINLVGSGVDHDGLVSQYLKDILKATKTRTVTARDGLLRVDIWGRLWVGLLSETGLVTWSLADKPDKLKALRISNGDITVERLPKKDQFAEGAIGLRELPSALLQNSGLLGPVNPDHAIPTLEMFRRSLKPHLGALSSDDLKSLEKKIAQFDRFRQEGTALKKYALVYRMQENLPGTALGKAVVSHLVATIKQYLLDALVEVPKKLHTIWIGPLKKGVVDDLKIWASQVPSWSLTLWHDPQAFLAPILTREILKAVAAEKIPESFLKKENTRVEFVERVNQLQDLAYSTIKKGIARGKTFDDMAKAFLVNHLGMDRSELEKIQEESPKQLRTFADELAKLKSNPDSGKFRLADINTLWQAGNEASLRKWYVKELGQRGILAAAADLVRVEVLARDKEGGGVYLDVDILPAFNKELFKHIKFPKYFLFGGELIGPGYPVNHAIINYLAQKGPEQLFFGRTPDPEEEKYYDRIKEEYPDLIKAIEEAIANHGKKPLFVFQDSLRVIPGSVEIKSRYEKKIHLNNNLIIAPPDSEVLEAVKKNIIKRYQLIERLNLDNPLRVSNTDINKTAKLIARELNIDQKIAHSFFNYRKDGILPHSRSTMYISGVNGFQTVSANYLSAFFSRKDLFGFEPKSYFMQINPLAKIDLISDDTDESPSSWIPGTDKTERYALTSEQDSRYKNQVILQLGDSDNETSASLYLANKYQPDFSQLIRLKSDGTPIDPKTGHDIELEALQADFLKDDTRIIVVGHGSKVQGEKSGSDQFLLGGKTVEQLADVLKRLTSGRFVHTVSLVGCGADASGEHYPVEVFARKLFGEIRTKRISVRNALVAVDELGRKWTGTVPVDGDVLWSQSDHRVKLVLEKDEQGQLMARQLPVTEGLVKKLRNLPALPRGRDYVRLGIDRDDAFDRARNLLLSTFIENNNRLPLSDLIEQYNRRLQQHTGDDFSPYQLMPLPVADAERSLTQARIPTERHMSAFVRADSIGDPLSGVGLLAYGDRFAQENFFRIQQAGYQLARNVKSLPLDAMAALFTRLLLGSLQDIVAPGGNDINPFRVSGPDLLVSTLAKDDLFALHAQQLKNDFSELG
ncbi:TcdA/TcdB catalytic glycosyltransferase domain-containing protein, partial [Endozoicomonas sp. ONNA1]|uniref:TcdA/TcdB catalytic glycosyltransferase domain-containing protein n=1 Tax=Endozoicomonas sp. ONNA1 TaxID=2828740 RepID=UPI002149836D